MNMNSIISKSYVYTTLASICTMTANPYRPFNNVIIATNTRSTTHRIVTITITIKILQKKRKQKHRYR